MKHQITDRSALANLVRDVGVSHLFKRPKSSEMEKRMRGNYLKHQEGQVSRSCSTQERVMKC